MPVRKPVPKHSVAERMVPPCSTNVLELGEVGVGELGRVGGRDVEDRRVVPLFDGDLEIDDLPVEGAFVGLAQPAGQLGHVARAVVPVAVELELIEDDRVLAADQEQQREGGADRGAPTVPRAIAALQLEQPLGSDLVPVGRAEVLVSARQAHAFHSVEEVIQVLLAVHGLREVLVHPCQAPVELLEVQVGFALDELRVQQVVEADEQRRQPGRGHRGPGGSAFAAVRPAAVGALALLPVVQNDLPVLVGNFLVGERSRPAAEHAVLAVGIVPSPFLLLVAVHAALIGVGAFVLPSQQQLDVASQDGAILVVGRLIRMHPGVASQAEGVGVGTFLLGHPVQGLDHPRISGAFAAGHQGIDRQGRRAVHGFLTAERFPVAFLVLLAPEKRLCLLDRGRDCGVREPVRSCHGLAGFGFRFRLALLLLGCRSRRNPASQSRREQEDQDRPPRRSRRFHHSASLLAKLAGLSSCEGFTALAGTSLCTHYVIFAGIINPGSLSLAPASGRRTESR